MIEMIPPHNITAEKAILGTLIIKPNSAHEAMSIVSDGDFYKAENQNVFAAISSLSSEGVTPDIVTISDYLENHGKTESTGGIVYLGQLMEAIANTAALKKHCEIVADMAKKRAFISIAQDVLAQCYEGKESAGNIANKLSEGFVEATKTNSSNKATAKDIVEQVKKTITGKCNGSINPIGITSGLPDLDKLTGGWQDSDLIIIAGRPGMGKTTIGMNFVISAAKTKKKVLVFSMEMSKEKLIQREMSAASGVNFNSLNRGLLTDVTFPRVMNAGSYIAKLPITIDDSSALHFRQIQSRAKHEALRDGVDLIVIDYLGLAKGNSDNKTQEVTEISGGLKALAKDLKVPVVALSQLNRGVENRTDKRPVMSDLRDSGAIEQDASVICFLYRDEVYNKDQNNPLKGLTELTVSKNREGECGTVDLTFDGATSSFRSVAKFNE